ncbi:MAG TPA: hypothetical protein VMV33_17320 [Rhodocyclaceae bacterium]|nr:hypothetical protein [Rhodocyclaceae bacterium]
MIEPVKPRALRWGNMPVPYTALWSGEVPLRKPAIVREEWEGVSLSMISEGVDAPAGKPLFAMVHADRARRVIRELWCQMCLADLPPVVLVVNQGQVDRHRPVINDGLPMCWSCASAAVRACPGMQRQAAEGTLRIWRVNRGAWLHAPVLLGVVPVERGGDEAVNALVRAARGRLFTGPKLVLMEWEQVLPGALDAETGGEYG